jgi:phosphopantothenoylcysteine decarboxylase / phosphopantothenate---cysteine ligase
VSKNLALIVANDVLEPGAGFEHDTNKVMILSSAGIEHDGALTDKRAVASAVLDAVVTARASASSEHENRSTT